MRRFISVALERRGISECVAKVKLSADLVSYCILACHTAVPTLSPASFEDVVDGAFQPSGIQYQASSPDEHAILNAFRQFNLLVIERSYDFLSIDLNGKIVKFKLLNVLEFTSARKMMSVIVQNCESNDIFLYCKGADDVVCEKSSFDKFGMHFLQASLTQFAEKGLRTLCFAYRIITKSEYDLWNERLNEAQTAVVNREKHLYQVMSDIERDLNIVGVTGIEDKLQEGVPDSIKILREAGIQLWVLTGDKTETAINIGYSCGILDRDAKLLVLEDADKTAFEQSLDTLKSILDESTSVCLVLSGRALELVFADVDISTGFVQLAVKCKSVLCCRATPRQKATVVDAVRKTTRKITLAIGDGANDVAMIQAAHVGIGIHGREGMQAASASDYSIGQIVYGSVVTLWVAICSLAALFTRLVQFGPQLISSYRTTVCRDHSQPKSWSDVRIMDSVIQSKERSANNFGRANESVPLKHLPADIANRMNQKFSRIRTVFNRKSNSGAKANIAAGTDNVSYRGFAFSQEENGVVLQSQVVRSYCTSTCRPSPTLAGSAHVNKLCPTISSAGSSSSENDSRTRLLSKK
ncbi:hypothetical protein ACOME3_005883 [Neoechinorhynchus agilis]